MIPATTFAGKTVAVFGLGGSGLATAQALIAGGATVAAWDDGEAGRKAAADRGIPIVDLSAANWSQFSSLVLAPGVPLTHPEPHWVVLKARDAGIEIIGDIEIFRPRARRALPRCALYRHHRHQRQIDDDGACFPHPARGRPRRADGR